MKLVELMILREESPPHSDGIGDQNLNDIVDVNGYRLLMSRRNGTQLIQLCHVQECNW